MGHKSITLESSINFKTDDEFIHYICNNLDYVKAKIDEQNRIRENARAFVKEFSRIKSERLVHQINCVAHFGFTRQDLSITAGTFIFRRNKNHRTETEENTIVGTFQTKEPGI